MKKVITWLIIIIISVSACDIEQSNIGELEGLWQLYRTDTIATGGSADLRESQLSWAFQGELLEMKSHPLSRLDFVARYTITSDSLFVEDLRVLDREKGDPLPDNLEDVKCFGINTPNEHFRLLFFNKEQMRLQSETLIIYLRKY